jgi:hypothetical protein
LDRIRELGAGLHVAQAIAVSLAIAKLEWVLGLHLRIQRLPGTLVNQLLNAIVAKDPMVMTTFHTHKLIGLEVFGVSHDAAGFTFGPQAIRDLTLLAFLADGAIFTAICKPIKQGHISEKNVQAGGNTDDPTSGI